MKRPRGLQRDVSEFIKAKLRINTLDLRRRKAVRACSSQSKRHAPPEPEELIHEKVIDRNLQREHGTTRSSLTLASRANYQVEYSITRFRPQINSSSHLILSNRLNGYEQTRWLRVDGQTTDGRDIESPVTEAIEAFLFLHVPSRLGLPRERESSDLSSFPKTYCSFCPYNAMLRFESAHAHCPSFQQPMRTDRIQAAFKFATMNLKQSSIWIIPY